MPSGRALPRLRESFEVKAACKRETQLTDVDGRIRRVHAVKEHPLLQRRKRITLFNLNGCLRLTASGNDRSQGGHKIPGEFFDRELLVERGAVIPIDLQLMVAHVRAV